MASLLVESDEKRRKTSEEEDGIRTLKELPDALLVFVMDFLRYDFKCWASLLGTCKYVHNHYGGNLVELKILWEKAQSIECSDRAKRALYNFIRRLIWPVTTLVLKGQNMLQRR